MHIWYGPALRREAGAIGGVLRVSAPLRGLDLFHLIIHQTTLDASRLKRRRSLGLSRKRRGEERRGSCGCLEGATFPRYNQLRQKSGRRYKRKQSTLSVMTGVLIKCEMTCLEDAAVLEVALITTWHGHDITWLFLHVLSAILNSLSSRIAAYKTADLGFNGVP